MKKSNLITIILLLIIFSISNAEDKISLTLQLKKDDVYRVTIPVDMPTDINIKVDKDKMKKLLEDSGAEMSEKDKSELDVEQNISLHMDMEIALILKVVSVDKIDYKLEAYYEYMETSLSTDSTKTGYSTRKKNKELSKEEQAEYNSVKNIIGKKFYLTIANTGELKELNGYEKAMSSLGKKAKTDNPLGNNESILIKQLDKSQITTTIKGIFDILPDKTVKPGDSWTKELNVEDNMAPYKIKTKYTLKEINATNCRILSESIFYSDRMQKNICQVSGDDTGDILLSKNDNFVQTQPYTLNMVMDMEFLGMIMKTKMNGKGTYKIEKL